MEKHFEETSRQIAILLGISPEDIFWLQVDYADAFLRRYMSGQSEEIELMKNTPEFWRWWRQVWFQNDLKLCNISKMELLRVRQSGEGLDYYKQWHHPQTMDLAPNQVVIRSFMRVRKKRARV